MKRLFAVAGIAMVLLAACGGTDRPEGVVERWLTTMNQGKAGEPQKYASTSATNRVLPGWSSCDTGSLDVIEVGAHATGTEGYPAVVLVPYRIKYVSDLSSCDSQAKPSAPLQGAAIVQKVGGDWRVTGVEPATGSSDLRVPSEGGKAIGTAPVQTWLLTLGISALLMLLVAFLIRLTPKPAALPTEQSA